MGWALKSESWRATKDNRRRGPEEKVHRLPGERARRILAQRKLLRKVKDFAVRSRRREDVDTPTPRE
jgi:hypothetical protein